jgi:5-methyltetrahydrofolate--homocysteine methyltransferase
MTRTVISSATKEVIIGFDQPFCVIGERINPTGRKKLAAELEQGDFSTVEKDALEQVACGATVLDINSGAVFSNKMAEDPRYADNNFVEPPLMKELVERVQAIVDVPLCIDSSVPGALENGLQAAKGRPLLNSVTGEEERLETILPLVKKYDVPVVAISNDDTGISEDPDVRFAVAKKIVERAADHGIKPHDIVVDPLVMPVGAMGTAGLQVFALVRRLREELGVNTTCGASNISFGLPNRHGINNAFLPMAAAAGMTSAIMNPVQLATSRKKYDEHLAKLAELGVIIPEDADPAVLAPLLGAGHMTGTPSKEIEAIKAADFLLNNDEGGAAWIRFNKPAGGAPKVLAADVKAAAAAGAPEPPQATITGTDKNAGYQPQRRLDCVHAVRQTRPVSHRHPRASGCTRAWRGH